MANVRAARNGNWSDTNPATSPWGWSGVLYAPAAGDEVHANSFAVTIDTTVSVGGLRNAFIASQLWKDGGTATGVAGGGFTATNGNNITLTGTGILSGTTDCLVVSGSASLTITTTAVNGSTTTTASAITCSGSGTVVISCSGAVTCQFASGKVIRMSSTCNGTVTITASYYYSAGNGNAVATDSSSAATVTTNGRGGISLNSVSFSPFVHGGSGTWTHNGDFLGLGSNMYIFSHTAANTLILNGNVTAGSGIGSVIQSAVGSTTKVNGNMTASTTMAAYANSSTTGLLILNGSAYCASNGFLPWYAYRVEFLNSDTNSRVHRYYTDTGVVRNFTTGGGVSGYPAATDVRYGTAFGPNLNDWTGSLVVPAASTVAYGITYDNGTAGTAVLTAAGLTSALGFTGSLDTKLATLSTNTSAQSIANAVDATVPTGRTRAIGVRLPDALPSTVGGLPLSVDTSGRVDVLKVNGTSQTAGNIVGLINAMKGADGKVVISTDVQSLGGTLSVNAQYVGGYNQTGGDIYNRLNYAMGSDGFIKISSDSTQTLVDAVLMQSPSSGNPSLDTRLPMGYPGGAGGIPIADANNGVTVSQVLNTVGWIGQDNKVLISSDAQDLSLSLSVNAQTIAGQPCYFIPDIVSAIRLDMTSELSKLDAAVSSRMATFTYTAPPTASDNAAAVRTNLATELGRIDAAVSTRMATFSYTAPPTAAANATAVRAELATELARIDASVSSRLATASYTIPPTASDNAAAVRTNLTTELSRVDTTVSSRMATFSYTAPPSASDNAAAVRTNLETELARLAICATVPIVGELLAAYDTP